MKFICWNALLLFGCICTVPPAFAQSDSLPSGELAIMLSPQHLLLRGYHLEVESKPKRLRNQGILLSARLYAGSTRFADQFTKRQEEPQDFSRVKGLGAELQHRFYLPHLFRHSAAHHYLAYGVSYHHFKIGFEKEGWVQDLEADGLRYYQYRYSNFTETINRLGAIVLFGTQQRYFSARILTDGSIGIGYNHSSTTSTFHYLRFDRNLIDYGYSGFYFFLGFKVGVILR